LQRPGKLVKPVTGFPDSEHDRWRLFNLEESALDKKIRGRRCALAATPVPSSEQNGRDSKDVHLNSKQTRYREAGAIKSHDIIRIYIEAQGSTGLLILQDSGIVYEKLETG
jgi:hypothetical protein